MIKVSYCTTCKGRVHQMYSSLKTNLESLKNINAEWIIIDYNCPDNISNELVKIPEALQLILEGKLKVYKLYENIPFIMSLSKNLSHSQASGDYVFNLDIDNFISDSYSQLIKLDTTKEFLVSGSLVKRISNGAGGRLGLSRKVFSTIGGYDLDLDSVGYDDINLYDRLIALGYKPIFENNIKKPIQNTAEDTIKYIENIRPISEVFYESLKVSAIKLKNKQYSVNKDGATLFNGEDMLQHLVRIGPRGDSKDICYV